MARTRVSSGKTGLGISTQLPCDLWRTLKGYQGMSDNGRGSLGSHFNDGKGGLLIVVFTLFGSFSCIK